ncbi:MAG: hypothetical protein IKK01_10770 [Clostridia bacterium]|nr:hypothetical protein [Clostridia bacterium]
MKSFKFKNAIGVERMYEDGFGGIDRTRQQGNCYLTENLDLDADGSLKTRAGYASVAEYQGNLRASFNFADKLYSVIGNSLVVTDVESGISTLKGTLENGDGEADIFCFGGEIYIHDGKSFYRLEEDELMSVEGYAPLYGQNWDPETRGSVNEDMNLFSNRVRISFAFSSSTDEFHFGVKAASIDRFEINGRYADMDDYDVYLDKNDPSIAHTMNFSGAVVLTFWLTLQPESTEMYRVNQVTKAFVMGNNGGERLCLYHPGLSCNLYSSQPISRAAHAYSQLTASNAIPLYVPASSALCIGSGAYAITSIAHHYGRGILFTENDAWCIDWDGEEANESVQKPKNFLLNSAIGAEHIHSSAYFDNDPITYYCGRLWRWHSQSGVRDECSASMISDGVTELIPKDSEKISMLSLPQKQKIFIADAEDGEGRLLVYDLARKVWTIYSGIFAERLFRYGNLPAFSRGGCIYVFFDDLTNDNESDEVFPIKSKLVTHFLDFGCPEKTKRSATVVLEYDLSGGSGTLTLETEKGERVTAPLHGKAGGGREQYSCRIPMPRFKKLRLSVETDSPAVIYNAILSAK